MNLTAFRDELLPSYPYRVAWKPFNRADAREFEAYLQACIDRRYTPTPLLRSRFGRVLVGALEHDAPTKPPAPAPPPVPAPVGLTTAFDGAGIFTGNVIGNADPRLTAVRMVDAGFKWIAVEGFQRGAENPATANLAELAQGWFRPFVDTRIPFYYWALLGDNPEADAALTVEHVRAFSARAVIACAEFAHQLPQDVNLDRSRRYKRAIRQALGRIAIGVSCLAAPGRDAGQVVTAYNYPFDYEAWLTNEDGTADPDVAILPETYWSRGLDTAYEAGLGMHVDFEPLHAARYLAGPARDRKPSIPRSRVKPTVACAGYGGTSNHTPDEYVANLQQAGTRGFSVYLLEQMQVEEWPVWKRAIRDLGLAAL